MSAERTVNVICDDCGFEQPVTSKETAGLIPTVHSARLYLWMQGWATKGREDFCGPCANGIGR